SGASRRTSTFVDTDSFEWHPARVTIKHWQLRDLVCKTSVPNEVMYVSDRTVCSLDLRKGNIRTAVEFDFEPRCMAADFGVVAAGGMYRGQIGIARRQRDPDSKLDDVHEATQTATVFELGGSINNSISLYKPGSSSVHALVCNNDHTLRVLDIRDSRYTLVDTVQTRVPLNHASISPDRKTIIACGDSAQLFMFHPDEGISDHIWAHNSTLSTSGDAGFSTAFNSSGTLFAVASQDGKASVYDSRYLQTYSDSTGAQTTEPLIHVISTRPREGAGAFRCLKFSTGAEDLLMIAEQTGLVHVVDARRLEDSQVLEI
ncbi:WD40-repeat-containing domain protein, partial [Dipodascopsis uninucleata]